ncbi:MAG: TolC family protein [Prevotellaceae bacterium]|jgi:outer membrane protein TolC|nr:TolC family protein [Prevotellaceae bacterium]
MTRIFFTTVMMFGIASIARAQSDSAMVGQPLSIDSCQAMARANYPLIRQLGLVERTRDYNLANASRAWLPQLQLSAKATYQSDVTQIPLDFSQLSAVLGGNVPTIPELARDQYNISLELSQTLWDGGSIRARRASIGAQSEASLRELEANLYAVGERVNQLFFGALLLDEMLTQNTLYADQLQLSYARVEACVSNGIAMPADLDAVRVEQLKAQQQRAQLTHRRAAYIAMLAALTGTQFGDSLTLAHPAALPPPSTAINRPELATFDAQLGSLNAAQGELHASLMPRVGLFITGGFGKPGLNMLDDKFAAYYIGGIRLTWNIGVFYTRKNTLATLEANRSSVAVQRETFLLNTQISRTSNERELDKYRDLLQSDDEIIALHTGVRQAAEVRLTNGTLTAADLLRELNAEQMARQEKIVHEVEMLQAAYNLKHLTNSE